MAGFSMTCTCGHTMTVEAPNREQAVAMFKAGMTQQALDDHLRQNHRPDEAKPSLEQAHAMIDQMVVAS